jgi:hypothetical protein
MDLLSSLEVGTWMGGMDNLLALWHVLSFHNSPRFSMRPVNEAEGRKFILGGLQRRSAIEKKASGSVTASFVLLGRIRSHYTRAALL